MPKAKCVLYLIVDDRRKGAYRHLPVMTFHLLKSALRWIEDRKGEERAYYHIHMHIDLEIPTLREK